MGRGSLIPGGGGFSSPSPSPPHKKGKEAKMKKLIILLIVLFASMSYAADKSVTLQWEQEAADLPYITGWEVSYSVDNQDTWTSFPPIPYTDQQDTYQADEMVIVSDTGFTEVFFRARTLAENNNHSDYCAAIGKAFGKATKVINFKFKVVE